MKHKVKLAIFWLARALGLFAAARLLTAPKVRILCYHGTCLGDESRYNPKLFCSSAMLAERMQRLKSQVSTSSLHGRVRPYELISASLAACRTQDRQLQKYLDGPYFAAFSVNSSLLTLRNRRNLPSPSYFLALTP